MRIESSVTTLSWIPSEAIASMTAKLPFELGVAHYDETPPDVIDDLTALRATPTGSASPTAWRPGSRWRTARSSATASPAAD